ncbi:hypothetical protein [Streptomyces sp. NPDC002580]|uniref:hypothetical protein n=1 Tax=Streptomyces sp. NPDC002580 TaxID=3364653 RepID=UPI00367BA6E8
MADGEPVVPRCHSPSAIEAVDPAADSVPRAVVGLVERPMPTAPAAGWCARQTVESTGPVAASEEGGALESEWTGAAVTASSAAGSLASVDLLLPVLVGLGSLVAVLGFFTWLAAHVRRRGLAGGAMSAALASYEEAFRNTSHAAHVEIRVQAEREARHLSPDVHRERSPGEVNRSGERDREPTRTRLRRPRRGLGRWVERLKAGR